MNYLDQSATNLKSIAKTISAEADAVAQQLTTEILDFFDDALEVNVLTSQFRRSLFNSIKFVLSVLLRRAERCVVIPDAIPGFTIMALKKQIQVFDIRDKQKHEQIESVLEAQKDEVSTKVAGLLINEFLQTQPKHKNIIVVDSLDYVVLLFPVDNLVENLKEMGFTF